MLVLVYNHNEWYFKYLNKISGPEKWNTLYNSLIYCLHHTSLKPNLLPTTLFSILDFMYSWDLVIIVTPCRTYLYCGQCVSVFSRESTHRAGHKLYCKNISICFSCGKLGPCTRMQGCTTHAQPATVASRHEVNASLHSLLEEFQLRGQSTFHSIFKCKFYIIWYYMSKTLQIK